MFFIWCLIHPSLCTAAPSLKKKGGAAVHRLIHPCIGHIREYPPPPLGKINVCPVGKKIKDDGMYKITSTPDNSNLQEKSKKVRVIGSSKEIAGSKEKKRFLLHSEHCNHF